MIARIFALLLLWPTLVSAQGFAGLGTQADGFSVPAPGYVFDFPKDHGPHPDFRIEWWYLTANLEGADGMPYGVQWTLFRSALAPETKDGWQDPQIWFAHAAVTTPSTHLVAERIARGGIGQAGVTAQPFEAWIDDWYMKGPSFEDMRLTARGTDFAYDLDLSATGPLVFHGDNGFSVKSAQGQASYYYSQPYFAVTGTLSLPDGSVDVTGRAWLDREWSSQPLADNQSGWDWFSLSFDSGDKLMGFLLRQDDGTAFSSATWIAPDGTTTAYPDGAFAAQPLAMHNVAGRTVPTRWAVQLPDRNVDVTVSALNPDAWMGLSIPYWEGPVTIAGSHSGRGYLEMTGYE
ncbi:lipocalin-like domain-containing protein [Marivita sp. S0852]|uniref:lipocalin-like domain-containing protein n=1 Tax=Marivita sp. S0852 TaxID=3373893 RepID=UPI003981D4DB